MDKMTFVTFLAQVLVIAPVIFGVSLLVRRQSKHDRRKIHPNNKIKISLSILGFGSLLYFIAMFLFASGSWDDIGTGLLAMAGIAISAIGALSTLISCLQRLLIKATD